MDKIEGVSYFKDGCDYGGISPYGELLIGPDRFVFTAQQRNRVTAVGMVQDVIENEPHQTYTFEFPRTKIVKVKPPWFLGVRMLARVDPRSQLKRTLFLLVAVPLAFECSVPVIPEIIIMVRWHIISDVDRFLPQSWWPVIVWSGRLAHLCLGFLLARVIARWVARNAEPDNAPASSSADGSIKPVLSHANSAT